MAAWTLISHEADRGFRPPRALFRCPAGPATRPGMSLGSPALPETQPRPAMRLPLARSGALSCRPGAVLPRANGDSRLDPGAPRSVEPLLNPDQSFSPGHPRRNNSLPTASRPPGWSRRQLVDLSSFDSILSFNSLKWRTSGDLTPRAAFRGCEQRRVRRGTRLSPLSFHPGGPRIESSSPCWTSAYGIPSD
jgi:hypothetical protein